MRTGFPKCLLAPSHHADRDVIGDWDERSCPLVSKSARGFMSKRFASSTAAFRRGGPGLSLSTRWTHLGPQARTWAR
jgi:hypothetical protein